MRRIEEIRMTGKTVEYSQVIMSNEMLPQHANASSIITAWMGDEGQKYLDNSMK